MTGRCLLAITGAFHLDGGIAAVNRLVIRALGERDLALDVLALNEPRGARLDERYADADRTSYFSYGGDKIGFAAGVSKMHYHHKYDCFLFDHINLAIIGAVLRFSRRYRYGVWIFGIEAFPPKPDLTGRLGLLGATKILAISNFTRESVTRRFPNLSIDLCELALDPIRYGAALPPEPETWAPSIELQAVDGSTHRLGAHCLLNVGRMVSRERYKGQASLLAALPVVAAQQSDVQLVLAGQGDDYAHILALARSLPPTLQGRVFMPGFVDNELLKQLYHACYLFAMPSIGEGFGLVFLEAMSRAKPCIGGNTDATSCVVEDGVTGLLVDDPRSPDDVAGAILRLTESPERARAMGLAGYDRVRSRFLYPHFAQRFWNIMEV